MAIGLPFPVYRHCSPAGEDHQTITRDHGTPDSRPPQPPSRSPPHPFNCDSFPGDNMEETKNFNSIGCEHGGEPTPARNPADHAGAARAVLCSLPLFQQMAAQCDCGMATCRRRRGCPAVRQLMRGRGTTHCSGVPRRIWTPCRRRSAAGAATRPRMPSRRRWCMGLGYPLHRLRRCFWPITTHAASRNGRNRNCGTMSPMPAPNPIINPSDGSAMRHASPKVPAIPPIPPGTVGAALSTRHRPSASSPASE